MSKDQEPRVSGLPNSCEKVAREFLQWIEGRLNEVLHKEQYYEKLTFEDRIDLGDALETLRPSFNELAKYFEPFRKQDPEFADQGYQCAWGLMWAAFLAGTRTEYNEATKTAGRKARSVANNTKGVEANKRKAAAREEQLARHCRQINPRSHLSNNELAEQVSAVWTDGKPFASGTMSRKIAKLRKRCQI